MHLRTIITVHTLLFIFLCPCLHATTFYVDPINGSMSGDGSLQSPWSTLEDVFAQNYIQTQIYSPVPYMASSVLVTKNAGAPVQPGDTLMLKSGHHGTLFYRGAYNLADITIINAPGHVPTLARLQLSACSNWVIEGLTISPESAPTYTTASSLVFIESHGYHGPSHHVTIKNCKVQSVADATAWDIDDWNDLPGNGIQMTGDYMRARYNDCLNIKSGVTISGNHGKMVGNTITNFAGDGMRLLGSDGLVSKNVVKNCYDVNGNHDDGFQSFTNTSNPYERDTISSNTIINFTDPNQPFRGTLQGIGCFDGPYVDWVVENNLVVVNHYHGVTLMGADNCKIVNNTVIDQDPEDAIGPLWIRVAAHKDGTPSQNCHIRNNITTSITGTATYTADNMIITLYDTVFTDPANLDFSLLSTSAAIDAADPSFAPQKDIFGLSRPQGEGPDLGAIEFPNFNLGQTYLIGQDYIGISSATDERMIVIDGSIQNCTIGILDAQNNLISNLSGQSAPISIDPDTIGAKSFLSIQSLTYPSLGTLTMIKQ